MEHINWKYSAFKEGDKIKWPCPNCSSGALGRKGDINVHHWAHINSNNYDNWYEPITE